MSMLRATDWLDETQMRRARRTGRRQLRLSSWLRILCVWRWRRVCRRGVVLANRRRLRRPAPHGIAYTWWGERVGDATRDQLAAVLSGPPRRPEDHLSAEFLADLRAMATNPDERTRDDL